MEVDIDNILLDIINNPTASNTSIGENVLATENGLYNYILFFIILIILLLLSHNNISLLSYSFRCDRN